MEVGILVFPPHECSALAQWAEHSGYHPFLFQDRQTLYQKLNERLIHAVIASSNVISFDLVRQWREDVPEIYWILITDTPSFTWAEQAMLAGVSGFSALPIVSERMDNIMGRVKMQRCQRLQLLSSLEQSESSIDLSRPIESALSYITGHISERLTLASVSSEVYLSPSHFSRLFVQKVGMHFNEYVLVQRIEAARTLLAESHLPIEYIATKVGFNSASYFSQTFKRLTGRTPRAYRYAPVAMAEPALASRELVGIGME